jgi:hypothetical protein
MRNFQLLATGLDVVPLLLALKRHPSLWVADTWRQEFPGSPHVDTQTILLRFNEIREYEGIFNDLEAFDWPSYSKLPEARGLVNNLMACLHGERLGRAMIVNLPAGKEVLPHPDRGAPSEYYDRFHIVLQSAPGNVFTCGGESVYMQPGDLWWFDNTVEHHVVNDSEFDRYHLIVDIRMPR